MLSVASCCGHAICYVSHQKMQLLGTSNRPRYCETTRRLREVTGGSLCVGARAACPVGSLQEVDGGLELDTYTGDGLPLTPSSSYASREHTHTYTRGSKQCTVLYCIRERRGRGSEGAERTRRLAKFLSPFGADAGARCKPPVPPPGNGGAQTDPPVAWRCLNLNTTSPQHQTASSTNALSLHCVTPTETKSRRQSVLCYIPTHGDPA